MVLGKAPMPNPKRKLTAEQLRDLIGEYNIHFEGPIPPVAWPLQYSEVFQNIRNIDRTRYDEYESNENRGPITVAKLKKRVLKLNRTAYDCRRQRVNEASWRQDTEPQIVSRLGAEVVW